MLLPVSFVCVLVASATEARGPWAALILLLALLLAYAAGSARVAYNDWSGAALGGISAVAAFVPEVTEQDFFGPRLLMLGLGLALCTYAVDTHRPWGVASVAGLWMKALALIGVLPRMGVATVATSMTTALLTMMAVERRAKPVRFGVVAVGSMNKCKVGAVRNTIARYPRVASPTSLLPLEVPSGISAQPRGLEVTQQGAKNRAQSAYETALQLQEGHTNQQSILSLGIESGLFELQGQWFDVCVVSAYDGADHHFGLSCAFQVPDDVVQHVLAGGVELSEACNEAKITSDHNIGQNAGLIGILSGSRVDRMDYTIQAIHMALIFAEHPRWYPPTSAK